MSAVIVSGSFDDLRSPQVRFLQEAARLGDLHVLLWPDVVVRRLTGREPKFPQEERLYVLEASRYVSQVTLMNEPASAHSLPQSQVSPLAKWVFLEDENFEAKRAFCQANGLLYQTIPRAWLAGFPLPTSQPPTQRKKVLVTGCFDWLHSGHVRFFEEIAQLGELYVVVGNDDNVRFLKGDGHPLFDQEERRYMVQSIRYVTQALISTGMGWMDAEPEIERIQPDIYAVNQDGDKPEKRAFCEAHGLEYVVLRRLPKEGLPRRESTQLRGF